MTTTFGGLFLERCKFHPRSAAPALVEILRFPKPSSASSSAFPTVAGDFAFVQEYTPAKSAVVALQGAKFAKIEPE
jgi:hypothetical protein